MKIEMIDFHLFIYFLYSSSVIFERLHVFSDIFEVAKTTISTYHLTYQKGHKN